MVKMRWIVVVASVVLAVLLPAVASAQLDAAALARAQREGQNTGLYGGIPGMDGTGMEGEEGMEGEATDSTDTKEKRERKPLESYYFEDTVRALRNWKWTVDRDYNRVNISPGEY